MPIPQEIVSLSFVRIYEGAPHLGRRWLITETSIGGSRRYELPALKAAVTVGYSRLTRRTNTFSRQFGSANEPSSTRGQKTVRRGAGIRIDPEEWHLTNLPGCDEGEEKVPYLNRLVDCLEIDVWNSYLVLRRFLESYRLTRFYQAKDSELKGNSLFSAWVDTGRPEAWPDFRHNTHAIVQTPRRQLVLPVTPVRNYGIGVPGVWMLQEDLTKRLTEESNVSRLLMLDAWTAFFDGDIRLAIVLANSSLEAGVKDLLRSTATSHAPSVSDNRLSEMTRGSFSTLIEVVLPMTGWIVDLNGQERSRITRLRQVRNAMMHRGGASPSREEARELIDAAESLLTKFEALLGGTES